MRGAPTDSTVISTSFQAHLLSELSMPGLLQVPKAWVGNDKQAGRSVCLGTNLGTSLEECSLD